MEITSTKPSDHITLLKVKGRVDTTTAPSLDSQVSAALDSTHKACVLDLAGVDYISSAGLRVLVMGAKKASLGHGVFSLCGVQESVHKILEMVGFTPLLDIYGDEKTALDAAGKKLGPR